MKYARRLRRIDTLTSKLAVERLRYMTNAQPAQPEQIDKLLRKLRRSNRALRSEVQYRFYGLCGVSIVGSVAIFFAYYLIMRSVVLSLAGFYPAFSYQ